MGISSFIPPTPADPDSLRNPPPFEPYPLIQLRAGKIKACLGPSRAITSGIFKSPLSGSVEITKSGIASDEHAYEPHRSPDKALLQYCTQHYEDWTNELPASERFFKPGAFGENFFSDNVDEKTMCIGDKVAMGDVILEVTEPRGPCYKLNHRFEVKDMAKRTQTLLRTGWLYRVLQPGVVNAGDMIRLLERPYPDWTVARVSHYLFIETDNAEKMREIVEIKPLGDEIKNRFQARIDKGRTENQNDRMFGDDCVKMESWSEFRIVEKRKETSKVAAFVLESTEDIKDEDIAPVQPGSHVRVKLGGKLVRAYSVVEGTSKRFTLGVALDPESRGGSKYLHEQTKVGDVLTTGPVTASFPLAEDADEHIIIAGGIGITAFMTAVKYLEATKQNFHLHYAVNEEVPFEANITSLGANATIYNKSKGQRMDLKDIISHAAPKTHIYCCGSQRMTDAVKATAEQYGVPDSSLHFEQFAVKTSGDPFTAELQQSKKVVEVGGMQTLLDALKAVGMDVDSSCEVGNCGACRVDVCGGKVLHQGTALLEEEKGSAMLSCVSRGIGRIILDL